MPLRHCRAWTLRTYALGEADLIVVFYTLEYGRLRSVAKGAKRIKSQFGSAFQPLTRNALVFFEREGQELARVSSCEVEESFYHSLLTPEAAATAAYFAELVQEFTPERDPNPAIFRLIGAVMTAVDAGAPLEVAARYFEVWILRLSGLLPSLSRCGLCGEDLTDGCWVLPHPLEFVCRECRHGRQGSRWLSPGGVALVSEILKKRPERVASSPCSSRQTVQRLAAVNDVLIRGHLDKQLRSVRYLDRLRRQSRRTIATNTERVHH